MEVYAQTRLIICAKRVKIYVKTIKQFFAVAYLKTVQNNTLFKVKARGDSKPPLMLRPHNIAAHDYHNNNVINNAV